MYIKGYKRSSIRIWNRSGVTEGLSTGEGGTVERVVCMIYCTLIETLLISLPSTFTAYRCSMRLDTLLIYK